MLQQFRDFIEQENLLQKNDKVLLAVSGGVDSMVMSFMLHQAGFDVGLAHCNFSLRGVASDADEVLVKDWAREYKVAFYSTRFDTKKYAETHQVSIQMAARDLRYAWLENIRVEQGYKFIATAHHQNDVAETLIFNLTKGTGIAGLHGILPKNSKVIRPILFAQKEAILAYAKKNEIPYREDASNASTKYNRNKIRHLVLPQLAGINPQVVQGLYDTAQRFRQIEQVYLGGIAAYRKDLFEQRKNETFLSIRKLQKVTALPTVLFELLKPFGYNADQVAQIITALDGESGKQFFSKTHQIIKDRKYLILSKKMDIETNHTLIYEGQTEVVKSDLKLQFNLQGNKDFDIPKTPDFAVLDASKLTYPLMLRRWKKGDYFYPFGMHHKKKKLSRFFIDQKLSLKDKSLIWVLEDAKQRIVWVVGKRSDERFKVRPSTRELLVLQVV